jgi:hypothetical protein
MRSFIYAEILPMDSTAAAILLLIANGTVLVTRAYNLRQGAERMAKKASSSALLLAK